MQKEYRKPVVRVYGLPGSYNQTELKGLKEALLNLFVRVQQLRIRSVEDVLIHLVGERINAGVSFGISVEVSDLGYATMETTELGVSAGLLATQRLYELLTKRFPGVHVQCHASGTVANSDYFCPAR